jgi:hypothetical protein
MNMQCAAIAFLAAAALFAAAIAMGTLLSAQWINREAPIRVLVRNLRSKNFFRTNRIMSRWNRCHLSG